MLSIVIDQEADSFKELANILRKIAAKVEKGTMGGFDPTFNVEGEETEFDDAVDQEYDDDGILIDGDLDLLDDDDDDDY